MCLGPRRVALLSARGRIDLLRHPALQALADAAAARHSGTCCLGVHPLEGGLAATRFTHAFDAVLVSSAMARSVHARTETHTRAVEKKKQ